LNLARSYQEESELASTHLQLPISPSPVEVRARVYAKDHLRRPVVIRGGSPASSFGKIEGFSDYRKVG
jgi:hypothetical protein